MTPKEVRHKFAIFCILSSIASLPILYIAFYENPFLFFNINYEIQNRLTASDELSLDYLGEDSRKAEELTRKVRLADFENHIQIPTLTGRSESVRVSINGYTDGGYANRVYSVVSSMVVALLTDSALIIRWPHIDRFVEEPLSNAFHTFNESNELNADYRYSELYQLHTKYSFSPNKNLNYIMSMELPTKPPNRYLFNEFTALFFEICCNKKYFKKLAYYGLVKSETIKKSLFVQRNGQFTKTQKANVLFRIGYEVGGNLLNHLWIPKLHLRTYIDQFINENFKDSFVIGIQLRYFYLNNSTDTSKFLRCASKIEDSIKSNIKYKNGVKWFISSDSNYFIQRLRSLYPNKIISSKGIIAHIMQNVDGYERAIVDVELLSKCNQLIITGGSTFGFVAAMKNKKLPYYVNGRSKMSECQRTELGKLPLTPDGYAVF